MASPKTEAAPKFLIVAQKRTAGATATIAIANYIAQQLDEDGRVTPIVWSYTDPAFRNEVNAGRLGSVDDFPSREKAIQGARQMGAEFILFYTPTVGSKQSVQAKFELTDGKKKLWTDSEDISTGQVGQVSREDSSLSVAQTAVLKLLQSSSLKLLPTHPKVATPAPEPGVAPVVVSVPITAKPDTSSVVTEKAKTLAAAGKLADAITVVRDAIDASPFDASLRLLLIQLYEQAKDWSAAADLAEHSSQLMPDNMEFRKAAVRDLSAAGRPTDLGDQMNEIVVRDPGSQSSMTIQAQTYMDLGEYGKAVAVLDLLAKQFPKSEVFYRRALCRAILGGLEGVDSDVQEYLKAPLLGPAIHPLAEFSEKALQNATQQEVDEALSTFQQASIHPDSQTLKDQVDRITRNAQARSAFLQQIPAYSSLRESYGDLLLAQKLLIVAYLSLQDEMKNGSDDSMVDARINFGEAIKCLKRSREKLAAEMSANGNTESNLDLY